MGLCLGRPLGQQIGEEHSALKQSSNTTNDAQIAANGASKADNTSAAAPEQVATRCKSEQRACSDTAHGHCGLSVQHTSSNGVRHTGTGVAANSGDSNIAQVAGCARELAASGAVATVSMIADEASAAAPAGETAQVPCSLSNGTPVADTAVVAGAGVSSNAASGVPVQPVSDKAALQQADGNAAPRSVKFADPGPDSAEQLAPLVKRPRSASSGGPNRVKHGLPRRSRSLLPSGSRPGNDGQLDEAVLAKQVEILRSNKMGKLRTRRGGLDSSFQALQDALEQHEKPRHHVNTRAAGLKHIGFGPFKRENQDEFFIQVGEFGGQPSSNLFCVFDGHGTNGKDAALYSRQVLPRLLDSELAKYFERVAGDSDEGLKGAVEMLITEVFGETERSIVKLGVNLASSGTTASIAFQKGNRLWVAAAGDSRAMLCSRNARDQWRALPLTLDHRPRRLSERERIEAAGARVAPKRLPSGRSVGEPRMWLQNAHGPGLLLSRSLGDLTAATVGCTSDPEVTYTTLRPGVDHVLVMATDGVWDVLTNEQVCDIVVESPDPHIACRRVLDAALYEWEERMSADNITVLVVEFDWGEEGSLSATSIDQVSGGNNCARVDHDAPVGLADITASIMAPSTSLV